MLLSAKVLQSLIEGDISQNRPYDRWAGEIEVSLGRLLVQNPSSLVAHGLRGDWLEVSLLRIKILHSSNAYQILQRITTTFLQAVYSYPDLWPADSDFASVPLLNIIAVMVFGLPQQVDYDTTIARCSSGYYPHECAQCFPVEFQHLLADINACRDKRPGARDWRLIEYQLITWEGQPSRCNEARKSWMMIAWMVVQESWRLTLLAYLYMAVCRSASNEPQVQQCVKELLQVIKIVKKHDSPGVNIPFFIQYLMAGICVRSDKHRRTVRGTLLDSSETKSWKMPGADFVPVLDHLWHGARSGGYLITWNDYIHLEGSSTSSLHTINVVSIR